MSLVSIIVPIYNVEQYLRECIDSIIKQTYKNLEIILVDDGSPDNCGQICDEYAKKDDRIKVIHKENGGLSSARNAGLDIATGEYISFIDSDDYVSNNFIEELYSLCIKCDADIAECDFVKFTDKIEVQKKDKVIEKYSTIEMQEQIYTENYIKTIVVWNKLYKKYLYEKLRFPQGKINEDEFTTYKVFDSSLKNIAVTSEILYYYRYNENSIMGKKFNEKRLDVLEAYEERKEFYKEKKLNLLYEKTVIKYQEILKDFYLLTQKYIDLPEKYLKDILIRMKKNYKEYEKFEKISNKNKMKIFMMFPNLYCRLARLKDTLENILKNN